MLGHDCYPVTIVHPGTETTFTVTMLDGFDTDVAEVHTVDLVTKGTRRAFTHLNFDGTIHLDEMACCSVVTILVVVDPCTTRDNVHRSYYSAEEGDISSDTHFESEKYGYEDTAATPVLMLKTSPFGVGAVAAVVSLVNAVDTKSCTMA